MPDTPSSTLTSLYSEGIEINDAPLPPPPEVAEAIPPFHSHGPRSCGDHRHDATNITSNFPTYLKRHRRVASTDWLIACSTCHRRAGLSEMHDLPCGHMLCRDCVVAAARLVKRSIERNIKQIEDARKKLVEIDAALQGESGVEAREKKMLIRRHAQLQKNVMKLAGLTCCGMNSRLDQFLGCLRPEMSRELWLQIQWVCDSPKAKRVCAWPDCGAYLPVRCRYLLDGECARRWYCVLCEGNSMECGRILEAAQRKFPFLPRGQYALTPCR